MTSRWRLGADHAPPTRSRWRYGYPKELPPSTHTHTPGGDCKPDVICVQEALEDRDVLGPVGYDLKVCSAKKGMAQTVGEMVYDDAPTLKTCDPVCHEKRLCNQIYLRAGSRWKVVGEGCVKISSDSSLVGGHGRAQGKLAIRTMVWLKLKGPEDIPAVYVMCTHLTGGRFEDQYFVQDLALERKYQSDHIVDFFDARPGASDDDVGIIVGDFNATESFGCLCDLAFSLSLSLSRRRISIEGVAHGRPET